MENHRLTLARETSPRHSTDFVGQLRVPQTNIPFAALTPAQVGLRLNWQGLSLLEGLSGILNSATG